MSSRMPKCRDMSSPGECQKTNVIGLQLTPFVQAIITHPLWSPFRYTHEMKHYINYLELRSTAKCTCASMCSITAADTVLALTIKSNKAGDCRVAYAHPFFSQTKQKNKT